MSHEPIAERIRRHLIGLKMPRALEALQTVQSQIEQGQGGFKSEVQRLLMNCRIALMGTRQSGGIDL